MTIFLQEGGAKQINLKADLTKHIYSSSTVCEIKELLTGGPPAHISEGMYLANDTIIT